MRSDGESNAEKLAREKAIESITSCVARRDTLVAKGKASQLSAAVVFMPEHTLAYGQHGDDKCFCFEMYGMIKPWGCKVRDGGARATVSVLSDNVPFVACRSSGLRNGAAMSKRQWL